MVLAPIAMIIMGVMIAPKSSAANLKFLSALRQARLGNFKFKAATQINKLLELF
jgi:hypothetical protein